MKEPKLTPSVELSVLLVCHNSVQSIEKTLNEWLSALKPLTPFEIVVINDGSNDGTGRILDAMRRDFPQLRVIHQLHSGRSNAMRRAYGTARGAYCLQITSPSNFSPSVFRKLWARREEYSIVAAFCADPPEGFFGRSLLWMGKQWLGIWFRAKLMAPHADFRLTRTQTAVELLSRIPAGNRSLNSAMSLLAQKEQAFCVRELPISGKSSPLAPGQLWEWLTLRLPGPSSI